MLKKQKLFESLYDTTGMSQPILIECDSTQYELRDSDPEGIHNIVNHFNTDQNPTTLTFSEALSQYTEPYDQAGFKDTYKMFCGYFERRDNIPETTIALDSRTIDGEFSLSDFYSGPGSYFVKITPYETFSTRKMDERFGIANEAVPEWKQQFREWNLQQIWDYPARYARIFGASESDLSSKALEKARLYTVYSHSDVRYDEGQPPVVIEAVSSEGAQLLVAKHKIKYKINGQDAKQSFVAYDPHKSEPVTIGLSPDRLIPGLSFVEKYKEDIIAAAQIIANHHPGLSAEKIAAVLAGQFIIEIAAMSGEDPVQDIGACLYSGCPLIEAFEDEFNQGFFPRGSSYLEAAIWRGGSLIKAPMESQGYGPGQVILGLALESGASLGDALTDYEPHLSCDDFVNKEAALNAILDPEKVIFMKAVTMDDALTRLEQDLYNEGPRLTWPLDTDYPMEDRDEARQLALLAHANVVMLFPEVTQEYLALSQPRFLEQALEESGYEGGLSPLSVNSFFESYLPQITTEWMWLGTMTGLPFTSNALHLEEQPLQYYLEENSIPGISTDFTPNQEVTANDLMLNCWEE